MKTIKLTSIIVVVLGLAATTFGMEQAVAPNGPRPVAASTRTVGVEQAVPFNGPQTVATSTRAVSIRPKPDFFGTYSTNTASGDAGAVLVIPAVDSNEFVLTASKDLNVMCRVFDKELRLAGASSGGSPFDRMYYDRAISQKPDILLTYALGGGGRNTSCMYLQGYAAVFLMSVSFPLAPGPDDEKKEAEPNEPADVVWRQAEQELYGQPDALEKRDDPERIYDAAKVDEFQTNLIKTFKHAANTRCLAPDEWVIAAVWGPESRSGTSMMVVFRAKKSDIDAFSEETLNLEQFRQKVHVVTSPGGARPARPLSPASRRF
jgi:hypothetical protein